MEISTGKLARFADGCAVIRVSVCVCVCVRCESAGSSGVCSLLISVCVLAGGDVSDGDRGQ